MGIKNLQRNIGDLLVNGKAKHPIVIVTDRINLTVDGQLTIFDQLGSILI